MTKIWLVAAALGGLISVALGAATQHLGLDAALYEIAARYLMYHSLALLAVVILARSGSNAGLTIAGWCFLGGMFAFAGGLSLLAATGSPLGRAATPIGGTLFLIGWLALAWYGVQRRD
jgi:uncharacterized membrane protein YgdD (TMEM256/DUF423 family)